MSAPMPFARLRAAAPKLRTADPKVRAAAPIPKELREQQVEVWPKRSARLRLLLRRKKEAPDGPDGPDEPGGLRGLIA